MSFFCLAPVQREVEQFQTVPISSVEVTVRVLKEGLFLVWENTVFHSLSNSK